MKKASRLMTCWLLLVVYLAGCNNNASVSVDAPLNTVKVWTEAIQKALNADVAKSVACAAEHDQIDRLLKMANLLDLEADISGLKYEAKEVTATTAKIRVYGEMKFEAGGQMMPQPYDEVIPVIQENGKWVVCLSAP